MAFDEDLAARIRAGLDKRSDVVEKKMFGGLAFLLRGNMCVGVHGSALIVRLDPAETDRALAKRHTRPFDLTGRPMQGWILVEAKGIATAATLGAWMDKALSYVESLPAK